MPGIREEMIVFLVAVVAGAAVRLAYQCIRCFRRIIAHRILEKVLEWTEEVPVDDMTVLVVGVWGL